MRIKGTEGYTTAADSFYTIIKTRLDGYFCTCEALYHTKQTIAYSILAVKLPPDNKRAISTTQHRQNSHPQQSAPEDSERSTEQTPLIGSTSSENSPFSHQALIHFLKTTKVIAYLGIFIAFFAFLSLCFIYLDEKLSSLSTILIIVVGCFAFLTVLRFVYLT